MQNLKQNITTLFDPDIRADEELYHLLERMAGGLPSRHGNALLLLKLGIPTPSAGLALPRALREQMTVHLHTDVDPGKNFVRHVRPREGDDVRPVAESGGPVYRLYVSKLPVPQKHQVFERAGI